jgi:hypothetical protein
MTMTPERLAELDAVMAKATALMRAHEALLLMHDLDMHGACPDEALDEIAGEVDAAQRDLREIRAAEILAAEARGYADAEREIVASDSPLGRNGVPSHKEIARRALKGIDHE